MPSRNIVKPDEQETYYHVYARGVGKMPIFLELADFEYFEKLFARYLSKKSSQDKFGYQYPHYRDKVEILAFCLMNNHIHLLLYQISEKSMSAFMRSLLSSYSRYFNLKYKRSGPLFESRYKASKISQQSYLEHISRYIHLNPRYWLNYPYSSLKFYLENADAEWVQIDKIKFLFKNKEEYLIFLKDYEDQKIMLSEIKHELAN